MVRRSAGLLLYRPIPAAIDTTDVAVLLVHPGGPFWARKDEGAWSIPKGEYAEGEDPRATAEREFTEELGVAAPPGPRHPLGEVRQAGGKRVMAWAVEGDLDPGTLDPTTMVSNTFTMEWPPRSGRQQTFPEVDRAEWFDLATARGKILAGQRPLLDALVTVLGP